MFIIGVVSAIIIIISPFELQPRVITRDIVFFIIASIYVAIIFKDEQISRQEALGIYCCGLIEMCDDHFVCFPRNNLDLSVVFAGGICRSFLYEINGRRTTG